MAAPPEPGSLQEALCILIHRYKQEQHFYQVLAGLHPEGSSEKQESFDSFRHALFPYIERVAVDDKDRTNAILDRAFAMGPISVTEVANERPGRKK